MSPTRLMFRRILRFPGLPCLADEVDEVAAGSDKQARKVAAKEGRNAKLSRYGRSVVELEEVLHVLLQDQKTKLFNVARLLPESELAMATGEARISGDSCLPVK